MKINLGNLLVALKLLASLTQPVQAAISFSVTPTAVSNTYSGKITLVVTGLTNTETAVVQKFLDANTNGVIDAGDLLIQQFNLTDGQASVFHDGAMAVTNFNVPGDADTLTGQITAPINFQNGDFMQNIVGKYLYKISSPVGHFAPLTNGFIVTSFAYAQFFTGTVFSNNTTTAVANAVVILFQPSNSGGMDPQGGALANNSGSYTIKAPPGNYVLAAFRSNYLANLATAPNLTLGSSSMIITNLTLTNATQSISGKLVDRVTPTLGLPGLLVPLTSANNFLGVGFSDTNGQFTAWTRPDQWKIENNSQGLNANGYLAFQNSIKTNTTSGSLSGITIALPKATAVFYGKVTDDSGNPLAGIDIYSQDNSTYLYQSDSLTDTNGNYVIGALAGNWQVSVGSGGDRAANYIFAQGINATLTNGQAQLQNFTAILATNVITGNVKYNGVNLSGVGVYAYATINGVNYNLNTVDTDANGNYSLMAANGTWNVNVYDCGCSDSDSLNTLLGSGNYQSPNSQNITITNNTGTANFAIQPCAGVQIFTTNLPDGQMGVYYGVTLQGSTCSSKLNWTLNDPPDFPPGLGWSQNGGIQGTPNTAGTYHFSVTLDDGNGNHTNQNLSLYIAPTATPLQIMTTSLPIGTNGWFYSQTLQASGGQLPYSWSVANYSVDPPPNLILATNGVLSGQLITNGGPYYFDVALTDGAANTVYQTLSVSIVNPPLPPLIITNVALPSGTVGAVYSAQLGATGGQAPYAWMLATGSANPPPGFTLYPSGLISGTPTTNKTSTFKVQATDANYTTTNKVLSITINPRPVLGAPSWQANQFEMRLTGVSNQNYTLQVSTNLGSSNWFYLGITNSPSANSFILVDPNATNQQRFYRILIGP